MSPLKTFIKRLRFLFNPDFELAPANQKDLKMSIRSINPFVGGGISTICGLPGQASATSSDLFGINGFMPSTPIWDRLRIPAGVCREARFFNTPSNCEPVKSPQEFHNLAERMSGNTRYVTTISWHLRYAPPLSDLEALVIDALPEPRCIEESLLGAIPSGVLQFDSMQTTFGNFPLYLNVPSGALPWQIADNWCGHTDVGREIRMALPDSNWSVRLHFRSEWRPIRPVLFEITLSD